MRDRRDELLWPQKVLGTKKAWYYVEARTVHVVVEPHNKITTFKIGTKRLRRLLAMLESEEANQND